MLFMFSLGNQLFGNQRCCLNSESAECRRMQARRDKKTHSTKGCRYISMSLLRSASSFVFKPKVSSSFYSTMKEAIIHAGPKVEIVDSPIPNPQGDQVVSKVMVSGSNPKDWKQADMFKPSVNQGDDIAGVVHSVGPKVVEFKPGDRIAAFHHSRQPGGSYAEYAISSSYLTFHIPKETSFEGKMQCLLCAAAVRS